VLVVGRASRDRECRSLGVIRVVRSMRKHPFTHFDEVLLRWVSVLVSDAFVYRRQARKGHVKARERLKEIAPDYANKTRAFGGDPTIELDDWDSVQEAGYRLLSATHGFSKWSHSVVSAVLRDLYQMLAPMRLSHVSLRLVNRGKAGEPELRVWAAHSQYSFSLRDDGPAETVSESIGSLGWDAIDIGAPVQALGSHPSKTRIARTQAKVTHALAFPMLLSIRGMPQKGVLSLDFEGENEEGSPLDHLSEEELQLVFAAAQRLSQLDGRVACENEDFAIGPLCGSEARSHQKREMFKFERLFEEFVAQQWSGKDSDGKNKRFSWPGILGQPPGPAEHFNDILGLCKQRNLVLADVERVSKPTTAEENTFRRREMKEALKGARRSLVRRSFEPEAEPRVSALDEDWLFYCEQAGIEIDAEHGIFRVPLCINAFSVAVSMGTIDGWAQLLGDEEQRRNGMRMLLRDALSLWKMWRWFIEPPELSEAWHVRFHPDDELRPQPSRRNWIVTIADSARRHRQRQSP
jgi:hypothetical protein